VSRDRQAAIPVLQTLLRGAPEIRVVVDRRLASVADRRASERRRAPSFYLV
jgi:hypothetical protein